MMTTTGHIKQLGASMFGVIFAIVAHVKGFMRSETNCMVCLAIFFMTVLGVVREGAIAASLSSQSLSTSLLSKQKKHDTTHRLTPVSAVVTPSTHR